MSYKYYAINSVANLMCGTNHRFDPPPTTEDSEHPILVFIVKNGYAIVIEQVFILTNRTGKY